MLPRFLLDEHISPDVADLLNKHGIETVPLKDWHDGNYLAQPDEQTLLAAAAENRTLVTFDVHSIPVILRHFAEVAIDHGGVVFISNKTVGQDDVGGIARGLLRLAERHGSIPLRNRVLFVQG